MNELNPTNVKIQRWRSNLFLAILFISLAALFWKLIQLQVFEYELRTSQADDNRTLELSEPPARGIIYDRNGTVLAKNAPSYNIVITPSDLPDDEADIQNVYRILSTIIGMPVNYGTVEEAKLVSECVEGPGIAQWVELQNTNAPYSPVKLACNVDVNTALIVHEKSMDLPGVSVQIEPIRDYPTGSLTANFIGFLGPIPAREEDFYVDQGFDANRDKVGYAGLEAFFQDILAGSPGKRVIERDVGGQEMRNLETPIGAESGYNIVTTIDTRLQKAAETALLNEIAFWNRWHGEIRITTGAVAAMNPKTGEILAMVSYPTFENNRFARFIPAYYYNQLAQDPAKPLLNHVVSDMFPPGSVFKLSTAVGALNEGIVDLGQTIEAPGELILTESFSPNDPGNERPFVDWNEAGFGTIDFLHCIAFSSNVCFYKLGGGYKEEIPQGLGIERLKEYARGLGYDQPSYIELLGEAPGLIPSPDWKRINRGENWSTGDTYIASVGQGYVLSTPLQVLMSAATIANDGKLVQPTLVKEIRNSDNEIVEIWRDNEGNIYRRCQDLTDPSPTEQKWCDTRFEITNNNYFQICDGVTEDGKSIKGWCTKDGDGNNIFNPGSWRISPQTTNVKWDLTKDPMIRDLECEGLYCEDLGTLKTVESFVIRSVQQGMRMAVTEGPTGTLFGVFNGNEEFATAFEIPAAGKTGTAEYCDDVAQSKNLCQFGSWPTHSWTTAYAPYDNPEIAVVAFFYNGGEGASVAAPVVRRVLEAYFELKAIDQGIVTP